MVDKKHADASTTRECRKADTTYSCGFNDAGFQSSISEFKKLNLMNGKFYLKLGLAVDTVDGKVSRITLSGDRGNFANLLQFVSTVDNIAETFDVKVDQESSDLKKFNDDLGLMRGDDAADIGERSLVIKPYAAISCLYEDSHVSTRVECQFEPRS